MTVMKKCVRRSVTPHSPQTQRHQSMMDLNGESNSSPSNPNSPPSMSYRRRENNLKLQFKASSSSTSSPYAKRNNPLRSTPALLRFIYSISVAFVFVRTIWNSIIITRNWQSPTDIGITSIDFPILQHQQRLSSAKTTTTTTTTTTTVRGGGPQRKRESNKRRKRTLPTNDGSDVQTTIIIPPSPVSSVTVESDEHFLELNPMHLKSGLSWKHLCGVKHHRDGDGDDDDQNSSQQQQHHEHPIDSSSRILVSGILTHPLASELVFALVDKCGVETVMGLDVGELGPESAARYAFLLRQLPNLQIHRTKYPMTESKLEEIFHILIPTHIIRFEPTSIFHRSSSSRSQQQYWPEEVAVRTSIETLERYCNLILKQQYYRPEQPIAMLYITSSGTSLGMSQVLSTAHDKIYPIILQTYRARHGVNAAQLKLPEIYGPFSEGATWMTDDFLDVNTRINNHTNTNATKITEANDDDQQHHHHGPFIHVNDAVFSIIESLRRQELYDTMSPLSSLAVFIPPESLMVNMDEIQQAVVDLYAKIARGVVAMRLSFMLSWRHKVYHPYGAKHEDPTISRILDFTHKQLTQNHVTGLSEIQRRQNYLFPCVSECFSSEIPCRKKSVFGSYDDGGAIQLSQGMTQNCRYVLYVADFSQKLTDIPLVKDSKESVWPRDTLCQIAFVSDHSPLVRNAVQSEKKNRPGDVLHTSDLNGKLQHNKWNLIWVNHNVTQVEADYMMPKIVPGVFFSTNVTRAMYVEPQNLDSIPPMNAVWYMMAKQLDAKKQKAKTITNKRSGTALGRSINVPSIPAKHVSLFVHEFLPPPPTAFNNNNNDDEMAEDEDDTISINGLAKFVLQQKGKAVERAKWPRRQLQLYEDAFFAAETNADDDNDNIDDFELLDTFLMIHHLSSDRSRRLRCEWYEEQLFWSSNNDYYGHQEGGGGEDEFDNGSNLRNRDLEDLSLSYVLASWRRDGRLIRSEYYDDDYDQWGERIIDISLGDSIEKNLDGDTSPSQYFVKSHPAMRARKRWFV